MRILRIVLLALLAAALLGALFVFAVLPGRIDRSLNRTAPGPYEASERASRILAGATVVDLHADPLLWSRDLLARHDFGQVDLPRLLEGNVALQTFGVATKSPAGQNFERNAADAPDRLTGLVVAQRWPPRTWWSTRARALHQAERLHEAADRSQGRLRVITSRAELEALLRQRDRGADVAGGLLGLEGLHALEGELDAIDVLHRSGFRMMGLAHFFDNEAAGSSAGEEKYGLTELGRRAIARMESLGIAVDLAHASPAAIADVLGLATRPVLVSHTGVRATCPGPRNLSDGEITGIAETGGVVGIAYFEGAVCDASPRGIARAMAHVRDLVGIGHVALGSDFDGSIEAAFDTTGLGLLVDALLAEGFRAEEIRRVLGGNALRVLRETLPP